MKVVAFFAVVYVMFVPPASALECYNCVLCSSTSYTTPTQTCAGSQVVAGMSMPVKCAAVSIYEGPHTGVVRKCLPNVLNGCMDVNWQGYKAKICYCTTDRCNSNVFTPAENTPALPGPYTPTALTTTRDPANPIECYDCVYCSSVTSSTPTQTCKGTEFVAGMNMPLKCAMIDIYDGPQTGVIRKCAPNIIEGCMDVNFGGYKAKACYCSTDRCNTNNMDAEGSGSESETPALPMETTLEPETALQCYDCVHCPSVSTGTVSHTCEGSEVVAGVKMPLKCATINIYDGPQTGVVRRCAPNVLSGCFNLQFQGYKAKACYCTTDLCNDETYASKSKASIAFSSLVAISFSSLIAFFIGKFMTM